jgi:hypothetical protein
LKESISKDNIPKLWRKAQSWHMLLEKIFQKPVLSAQNVKDIVWLSPKAVNDLISDFVKLWILEEITWNKRNRVFAFRKYLQILNR